MNFKHLFEEQKKLDKEIMDKHNTTKKDTFEDRIIAMSVELSECINEVRNFKYWSNKPASPKEVILEEYVDIIHFLLSLGLDLEENKKINWRVVNRGYEPRHLTTTINDNFMDINKNLNDLYSLGTSSLDTSGVKLAMWCTYITLFESVLDLGYKLGFNFKDIEDMYYKKNAINHKRQEENY